MRSYEPLLEAVGGDRDHRAFSQALQRAEGRLDFAQLDAVAAAPRLPSTTKRRTTSATSASSRLRGDERRKALGALQDDLRHQPWVDDRIVGVHENAGAAGVLAPARYVGYFLKVTAARCGLRLRAGREDLHRSPGKSVHLAS
jgi:hypothetical protein